MRYIFIIAMLLCYSISSTAQTDSTEVRTPMYSVRHGFVPNETETAEQAAFRQKHLYQAGMAMDKASYSLAGSVGASALCGTFFGLTGTVTNSGGRTALYVAGGVMAAVSIGCLISTIHFHYKAGRELRLSASEVVYRF